MKLNDAVILDQLEGKWDAMFAVLVWKLRGEGKELVRITHEDLAQYNKEYAEGKAILLSHGHVDSISFKIVDRVEAMRLKEWNDKQRGHA